MHFVAYTCILKKKFIFISLLAHNSSPIMSDDEDDIEINSPEKQARLYSTAVKPALNFCNVIVTSALQPTVPELANCITVASVPKPALPSPLFTVQGLTVNKSTTQSSTASNNRTIAAMLSTSTQSLS